MRRRTTGLTLLELLVGLAIMALAFCFSVPFLHTMQIQQEHKRCINALKSLLQYARMQAFLRGETLVLAPQNNDKNWSHGVYLFVQEGRTLPPKNKEELYVWHWQHSGIQVSWHGFQSNDYLIIDAQLSRLALNGYFLIDDGVSNPEKITVSRFGQMDVS